MGKLLNSPTNADTFAMQKNNKSTSTNYGSSVATANGVNILIYILFVMSLGFSVYTFVCQAQYEDRIQKFQQLEERISVLEAKLRIFPIQFLQSLAPSPSTTSSTEYSSSSASSSATPTKSSTENASIAFETNLNAETSNTDQISHVLQKLSLQLSGMQRLRRDVTHLKASRRGERQASVQPNSECMCPAGKFFILLCSTADSKCTRESNRHIFDDQIV